MDDASYLNTPPGSVSFGEVVCLCHLLMGGWAGLLWWLR